MVECFHYLCTEYTGQLCGVTRRRPVGPGNQVVTAAPDNTAAIVVPIVVVLLLIIIALIVLYVVCKKR